MPLKIVTVSTTDADTGERALNDIFGSGQPMVFRSRPHGFQLDVKQVRLGDLVVSRIRHNSHVRLCAGRFPEFTSATLSSGQMRWSRGEEALGWRPGSVGRHPNTSDLEVDWMPMDGLTMQIPLSAVERAAENQKGLPASRLRFQTLTPLSPDTERQWSRLTRYVHESLARRGEALDHPLVLAQVIDTVATAALTVFPNTTMTTEPPSGPDHVAPAALRRAVAYIEAHAAEPITLGDIATAARTSGRAVQAAFRRHHDCTPMDYLRAVRLERAHQSLQAGDPTTATVKEIAAEWGFSRAARFRQFYRQRYGVTPSTTLRS